MKSDLFKIPIWATNLTHEPTLVDTCVKISTTTPSNNRSNFGGYQSPDITVSNYMEFKPFHSLLEKIQNAASEFARSLECKESLEFSNAWFNINGYKDFHTPHTHPQSVLSGVYYILAEPPCGNIEFYPPQYLLMHETWNKDFVKNNNEYTAKSWKVESKTGRLYIFPSWLLHSVNPQPNHNQRIALSFNFKTISALH